MRSMLLDARRNRSTGFEIISAFFARIFLVKAMQRNGELRSEGMKLCRGLTASHQKRVWLRRQGLQRSDHDQGAGVRG